MKKIHGIFNVSSTEHSFFNHQINVNIKQLQDDNQEVEVQYSTNVFNNGQIVYSALIIGRKDDDVEYINKLIKDNKIKATWEDIVVDIKKVTVNEDGVIILDVNEWDD